MGIREIFLFFIIASVVVIDQLTKLWIMASFQLYEHYVIIPDFFNLVYITNTGAAFGFLAGDQTTWRQVFFVTVAIIALIVITIMYRHVRDRGKLFVTSLGLIAGGAIGNLIDRVRFGAVVDFLDFYIKSYHWPAFNIADSAISVGVGLFLLASVFDSDSSRTVRVEAK